MPKAKRKTVPADDGGEIVWRSQVVHPRPALASGALLLIAIEPTVAQRAASNAQAATSEPCDRTQSRWSVLRRGRTGLHMSAANSRE
jgi:hypothetical protein